MLQEKKISHMDVIGVFYRLTCWTRQVICLLRTW
jgi:hypothetical protein